MGQVDDDFSYCKKDLTVLFPIEVGDYSILVEEDLGKATAIKIFGKALSKEIISSPEGSIIYFSEKLPKKVKVGKPLRVIKISPIILTWQDLIKLSKEVFTNEKSSDNGL